MSIQTVLGSVLPEVLGRTLTHEHLHMEFTHFYKEPPRQLSQFFTDNINIKNVGYIRQYPYSCKYNLILNDIDTETAVLNDIHNYKKFGGGTIVENTTEGLNRDLKFMKKVSEETKVHIVAGTGYYIGDLQEERTLKASVEDMYNHMQKEIQEGCDGFPSIKAGVIGEVASVWPIKDVEKRAIQAAGEVQEQLGCGVSFHPHREAAAPREIIRLYLEAGGRAAKAVMSHLDRTFLKDDELLEFSKLGTYCQFDLFGIETSYYQLHTRTDMPSDSQRLDKIGLLCQEGLADKVTVSHDIHTKHRLTEFGGHGYSHILNNIIPRMKDRGFTDEVINQITIKNPANWLQF